MPATEEALPVGDTSRIVFFAFDVLHLDGNDLIGLRLTERKAALERLPGRTPGPLLVSEHIEGHGKSFFTKARPSTIHFPTKTVPSDVWGASP
jgi:bifunctional non-homologous end joining protein LigD